MSVTFNIYGACVSRDIFPKDSKYTVLQYVAFSSPMSIWKKIRGGEKIEQIEENSLQNFIGSNFNKRCVLLDHNNQTFQYLCEKESDYLILDLADVRMSLIKYGNNYTTCASTILKNKKEFKKQFGTYEILEVFSDGKMKNFSEEEFKECIDWFCNEILKIYPSNKIILHKYFIQFIFSCHNPPLN